jgi:hypothetical protein
LNVILLDETAAMTVDTFDISKVLHYNCQLLSENFVFSVFSLALPLCGGVGRSSQKVTFRQCVSPFETKPQWRRLTYIPHHKI